MKKGLIFFLFFLIFNLLNITHTRTEELKEKLGCNSNSSKNYYFNFYNKKIKKIEIDTNNYRAWTVNNIKIITSNSRFISNNLKKKFDSTIKVIYEDNHFCILKGKIRHSGDAKDHIALKENSVIQSLDVTLSYGNIRGITRFKLFKPDVRGVLEDVVIQNQILRNLGYLAPRSIKVNTRVNETETVMLFQEKAAKELLEFNNRREGPILEGDQKFFFELVKNIPDNNLSNWSVGTPMLRNKSSKVMLSKLTNSNFINKGEIHKTISIDAINRLNLIYLYWSNRFQDEKNNFYYFDYDLDNTLLSLFDKDKIIKLEIYNLFMQSTNSHHALSASNRKFYWNSIENYFEPIVYDANPDIDREFSTTTMSKIRFPISKFYEEAQEILSNRILDIDVDELNNQIKFLGLNLSKDELERKKNKIINNLEVIKDNFIKNKKKESITHNHFKYRDSILQLFNDNLSEIYPDTYLIKQEKNIIFKCKIYLEECKPYNIVDTDFAKLLEGELEKNNFKYQFIGNNLDLENINLKSNYTSKKFLDTNIFYEDGIKIEIDEEKNMIIINQEEMGARAFIIDGKLQNTEIIFNGIGAKNEKNFKPKNFPIDIKGLTGCVSLINLELKNIKISASDSNCEDALNFINSNGSIQEVIIKNSFSDALDVDFSKLNIKKIQIFNARNDCADFSYGKYKLIDLKFINCGDKAVSIGETSNVEIKEVFINESKFGIATKDSSILDLHKASIENIETCLTAYNKKQEFSGGIIKVKEINCKNYSKKLDKDNFSEIFLEEINNIKKL